MPPGPLELGTYIGQMVRTLRQLPPASAIQRLVEHHDLDAGRRKPGAVSRRPGRGRRDRPRRPHDPHRTLPRRARRLAHLRAHAVRRPHPRPVVDGRGRTGAAETGLDVETMWTDDGFVVRFPETETPPDTRLMLPAADEVEELVLRQLGASAMFAAKFREAAGRALLLPSAGRADAARCGSSASAPRICWRLPRASARFRCCWRPTASACATSSTCRPWWPHSGESKVARSRQSRSIRRCRRRSRRRCSSATSRTTSTTAMPRSPSGALRPGDRSEPAARAARRGRAARAAGPGRARPGRGAAQHLDATHQARSIDGLHDLLLRLGDLTAVELDARSRTERRSIAALVEARRAIAVNIAESAHLPVERGALPRCPRCAVAGRPARFAAATGRQRRRRPRGATRARMGRSRPTTSPRRYGLGRATAELLLRKSPRRPPARGGSARQRP